MLKMKKLVDERQELELLRLEDICFWFLFWALSADIIVKSVFLNIPTKQYMGELLIFFAACAGFLIGCIKKGLWDYYTKPTMKTYLITSIIGSVGCGLVLGVLKYNQYEFLRENLVSALLPIIAVFTLFMFGLIFGLCLIMGKLILKKQQDLEKEFSDDNDKSDNRKGQD